MSMGWTNDLCHLKILLIFWRLYIHTHTCIKLIMILPVGMSNRYGQCLQIWSGDSILWRFWLSRWSICPERFLWGECPSLTCQNVLCSYTLSDWICKYRMIHLLHSMFIHFSWNTPWTWQRKVMPAISMAINTVTMVATITMAAVDTMVTATLRLISTALAGWVTSSPLLYLG